jgi:hypothetical protein
VYGWARPVGLRTSIADVVPSPYRHYAIGLRLQSGLPRKVGGPLGGGSR